MSDAVAVLLIATAITLSFGIAIYRRCQDIFHPAVLFMALSVMVYVILPVYLLLTQPDQVYRFLSEERVVVALGVVWMILAGCMLGFWIATKRGPSPKRVEREQVFGTQSGLELRLVIASLVLLGLGGLGYATNLADYGWAAVLEIDAERYAEERPTGYLGELTHALVPAALLGGFLAWRSRYGRVGLAVFLLGILPWLVSALLGGRRGPAIIALLGAVFAMNFWRRSLRLPTFMVWVALVALLVTFLIANRGTLEQRNYGNWAPLTEAIYLNAFEGNEFIYGGGAIAVRAETGEFYWGRRQIMTYLVRPIPRHIWPTKYEDAAEWLGLPEWQVSNYAVFPTMAAFLLGWAPPLGAAPGLAADLWIDWGPIAPAIGGLMAFALTIIWQRARVGQSYAVVMCGVAFSLLAYLVTQGLEAFLVRVLFLAVVVMVVFRLCGIALKASAYGTLTAKTQGGRKIVGQAGGGARGRALVPRASSVHPLRLKRGTW